MRLLLALVLAAHLRSETLRLGYIQREQLTAWLQQSEAKNVDRLEKIRALFTAAGCSAYTQPIQGQKLPNLICEIPGPEDSVIVVGAHYDKVNEGDGLIDNWTGTALLPALYASLKQGDPRKHKILLVAFGEEEKGLIGSKYFVSQIKKHDRPHYRAMVNIDSLGLGAPNVWGGRSDPTLFEYAGHIANALSITVGNVALDQVGLSDSFPFKARKIPAIDFHSITEPTWKILHTKNDNRDALQADDYWNSYRLIATYLAYLDEKLP